MHRCAMDTIEHLLLTLYGTTQLPIKVDKPWGYELVYAATPLYVGKILHVARGEELSLQYHNKKHESNLLQSGRIVLVRGLCAFDSHCDFTALTEKTLEPGDVWTNRPGDIHTIRAITDSDILEVSTPELDDVVRLRDNYQRTGTTKP